jgi:hypothetical protein
VLQTGGLVLQTSPLSPLSQSTFFCPPYSHIPYVCTNGLVTTLFYLRTITDTSTINATTLLS